MSDNAGAGPASPHQEFTVKLAKQGLTFEAGCAQTIILQEAGDKTVLCVERPCPELVSKKPPPSCLRMSRGRSGPGTSTTTRPSSPCIVIMRLCTSRLQ